MTTIFSLHQPHLRAKLIGISLIAIGLLLFLFPSSLTLKIAFSAILIGVFIICMITERSIPQHLSNAHIEGNLETVRAITRELNLTGNAMFLPKSAILNEERLFIPLHNSPIHIPDVDDRFVFSTGLNGESLGVSLPPSGLKLLQEIEPDADFEHTALENVEEKLQTFVGLNLVKSIALKHQQETWQLVVEAPMLCSHNQELCKQFPCPTCSAALTALTRSARQTILIQDVAQNGKKTIFNVKLGE